MRINTNPQLEKVQRVKYFGALTREWDVFIKLFLSRSRNQCRRGSKEPEAVNYSKKIVSSRPNKTDGLMETVAACTAMHRLKPDKVPALRKGRGHKVSFEIHTSQEGKKSISPRKRHWVW